MVQLNKLHAFFIIVTLASTGMSNVYASEQTDWSGYYVGVGVGELFIQNKVDYQHSTATCGNDHYGSAGTGGCSGNQNYTTSFQDNLDNTLGSLHAGYNWSLDNKLVLGIEPSFNFYHQSKMHEQIISDAFGDILSIRSQQNYAFNLRGNMGVPVDDFLFYIGGGSTLANVKTTLTQVIVNGTNNFTNTINKNDLKLGIMVGGGVKYHLDEHWVLGGEFTAATLSDDVASSNSYVASGSVGLTFPDTQAKNRILSETLLFNASYQF